MSDRLQFIWMTEFVDRFVESVHFVNAFLLRPFSWWGGGHPHPTSLGASILAPTALDLEAYGARPRGLRRLAPRHLHSPLATPFLSAPAQRT